MSVNIKILPSGKIIEVKKGTNLRKAINDAGFSLESPCAGHGVCLKCGVSIDGINLKTEAKGKGPGAGEEALMIAPVSMLSDDNRADMGFDKKGDLENKGVDEGLSTWVLACQTEVMESCTVTLPTTETFAYKSAFSRISRVTRLNPNLSKISLKLPRPSLEDQRPDWERLRSSLMENGLKNPIIDLPALSTLPAKLRDVDFAVEVVVCEERVVDLRPSKEESPLFGLAVDIGTTSVAVMLVDMERGWIKGVESCLNDQVAFGLDVIARIEYSSRGGGNLKELQSRIVQGINQLITLLCQEHKLRPEDIFQMVVVGNTTMIHLFLGMEAKYLALSPYIGASTGAQSRLAEELGLNIHPRGEVYVLPGISSFVGSDITGVILATNLPHAKKTILAIDLGTNGEVVLRHNGRLWAASTAAGPAFEGGGIHDGMRAVKGAISSFSIDNGEISYRVIGNTTPKGICGSGLIDLTASLYKAGIISYTGRLLVPGELDNAGSEIKEIGKRVREKDNKREFVIYNDYYGKEVVLTQQDIRQLQLAKGAVHAAIQILKQIAGLEEKDFSKILLAGTFGNYINTQNAITIGLLPGSKSGNVKFIGNAALEGALKVLVNRSLREKAEKITRKVGYIELSGRPDFQEEFIQALNFGRDESG